MGVYIEGFQLPEKSDMYYVKVECEAGKNPMATIWRKDLMGEMSFGAYEVIPVPPHGRLIEDVAVREQIDEWLDSVGDVVVGRGLSYYGELLGCIEDAPTIIPAEEGE